MIMESHLLMIINHLLINIIEMESKKQQLYKDFLLNPI